MNCAVCNQPMKNIPAGVSKNTGRAYNAFWACPDKHQQPRATTPVPVATQPVPASSPWDTQKRESVKEEIDWNAKDRQSMAQTAMKSASEIIAAIINAGAGMHAGDYASNPVTEVKEMANEFYKELMSMKSKT